MALHENFKNSRGLPNLIPFEDRQEWIVALENMELDSVVILKFTPVYEGWSEIEPIKRIWGGWKGVGPLRTMTATEIVNLEGLREIEFGRVLYPDHPEGMPKDMAYYDKKNK